MENLAEVIDEGALIEEALANFSVLIDDFDCSAPLEILGIGRMQFLLRKQMLIELKGLYAALWRLALGRSFPRDADNMFALFLERYAASHRGKVGAQIVERAGQYWGMLEPAGDADFRVVARHLASFVETGDNEQKPLILKLALNIRAAYGFIFDCLI